MAVIGDNACSAQIEPIFSVLIEHFQKIDDILSASLDTYMGGLYQDTRKYDLLNFWSSVSTDRAATDLMLDRATSKSNLKKKKRARNSNSRSESFEGGGGGGGSFKAASERLAEVYRRQDFTI